jgi:pyruvate,water dikinase
MSKGDYLANFGHRGPDEFELSVPRPAEDARWLDEQIELFRQSPVDVDSLLVEQRQEFERAWQRLETQYPQEVRRFSRRIDESARRARLREAVRSAYVRDRWSLRLFVLQAGVISGLGEDIFFLTLDEILDLLAGEGAALRFIPVRKETFHRYRSLPPYPPVIRGAFDPLNEAGEPSTTSVTHGSSLITGSPGSTGQVEGTVRVLADPDQWRDLQPGEILVAYQTDISWTLLFPRAAAVITDVGAPLSHAAIVARELGIPAVVGCGNATQRLKTGDRVRVNGGQGVVEILSYKV